MATKKKTSKTKKKAGGKRKTATTTTSEPKFPYATTPNSLRRFLELVPKKPKPAKVNGDTLRAWGLRNTNDQTIIRVLKALDLVSSSNEPTDRYTAFMRPGTGPAVLAQAVREVWGPLFEHSHDPHREDGQTLRNYFNIHSGGSEKTVQLQVQSFRAVCDFADFRESTPAARGPVTGESRPPDQQGEPGRPSLHIDLHIHLPENKSRRDYEYIFEDIARHILGRDSRDDDGTS